MIRDDRRIAPTGAFTPPPDIRTLGLPAGSAESVTAYQQYVLEPEVVGLGSAAEIMRRVDERSAPVSTPLSRHENGMLLVHFLPPAAVDASGVLVEFPGNVIVRATAANRNNVFVSREFQIRVLIADVPKAQATSRSTGSGFVPVPIKK